MSEYFYGNNIGMNPAWRLYLKKKESNGNFGDAECLHI